jgi:glutathione S-transferase
MECGMRLYGRRSSINVQKVLWCLGELGLAEGVDYDQIDAGLHFGVNDTPEYRALNPNGLVPTLVDGERAIWESNTILRYLATQYGNGELLPAAAGDRSEVERWMDWQLGALWATLRIAFLGLTRTPEAERNYDAIRASFAEAARLLRILDSQLAARSFGARSFVALERFTLADIVLALAAHRWYGLYERFGTMLDPQAEMPSLMRWLELQRARPAFPDKAA